MRRLWILGLGTAVVLAGIPVMVVRSRGSEPVEPGAAAQVIAVKEAVPRLLGSDCTLGTIPLTDSMGGIELEALIAETMEQTPLRVQQIYAGTVAAEVTQETMRRLDALRMSGGPVIAGVGGCTFAVDSWPMVEVTGDTATVEVVGTRTVHLTNSTGHDPEDPTGLTFEDVPIEVHLRQENGAWLLESATGTRPVRN